ncbi:hypothetical protein PGB90_001411 [Kerria lacca]
MLQLRLREVETETDAFRGENSHLDVNDCTTVDNAVSHVSHEFDKIKKSRTDEKSVKLVHDNSQYISKSVSFFSEETTTVYSPVKNESIRKIQFVTTDNIGSDSQTEHVQLIDTENLNETRKNEYDLLKSMLQLRLREVETETDAFRGENSHLGKLRDDYEKEYSKFCSEKVQFLATII